MIYTKEDIIKIVGEQYADEFIENYYISNDNYFSQENNKLYMSSTQFKDFLKCENEALAKVKGELVEEKSDALLFGGYIDAYFSNELDQFIIQNHADLFNSRTGELKAPFKGIGDVIKTIENDPMLMKYLNGEKQVIMLGNIAGVPFKIKIDSFHNGVCIVDQKIMKSITELTWVEEKHKKCDFIEAFGYDLQGAIYQEIVRQNTGLKLPFIIAATTKEENPDKALIEIDQDYLDKALELVKEKAPRFQAIKEGKIAPNHCGKCATCRGQKVLTGIVSYKELFNKGDAYENIE